jgi:hypothetical protein
MNQQQRDEYLEIDWTLPGWTPLIKELDSKLSELDPHYTIDQIKEKFGGLRYYLYSESENAGIMYKLEDEYEEKSYSICENCGSTEDVTTDGNWLKTFCNKCRES